MCVELKFGKIYVANGVKALFYLLTRGNRVILQSIICSVKRRFMLPHRVKTCRHLPVKLA